MYSACNNVLESFNKQCHASQDWIKIEKSLIQNMHAQDAKLLYSL